MSDTKTRRGRALVGLATTCAVLFACSTKQRAHDATATAPEADDPGQRIRNNLAAELGRLRKDAARSQDPAALERAEEAVRLAAWVRLEHDALTNSKVPLGEHAVRTLHDLDLSLPSLAGVEAAMSGDKFVALVEAQPDLGPRSREVMDALRKERDREATADLEELAELKRQEAAVRRETAECLGALEDELGSLTEREAQCGRLWKSLSARAEDDGDETARERAQNVKKLLDQLATHRQELVDRLDTMKAELDGPPADGGDAP